MRKRILSMTIGAAMAISATPLLFGQQPAATTDTTVRQTTTTTTTFLRPTGALSEEQIKSDIASAGYKEVKGLEFKDGVWQTKARGGNDDWVELKVGPITGKVYPEDAPSKLNKDEVKAKLTAQGYENIDDVEFDDGLWSADAKSSSGKDLTVLVDPDDGSVVAKSGD
ncbi:MAG: PepSY domain-containing protein [Rhodanobacteraceae bacterium]